jgi:hypothetical protein
LCAGGWGLPNAGPDVFASQLENLLHDLADQFFFAGEVIGNNSFTDPGAAGDLGQGGVGISKLGYRVDGATYDLGTSGSFNE